MKVKWVINTGFTSSKHAGEWDVDDDTSDEELDEMLEMEISNRINATWERQ